jgi:hypothetical protein
MANDQYAPSQRRAGSNQSSSPAVRSQLIATSTSPVLMGPLISGETR